MSNIVYVKIKEERELRLVGNKFEPQSNEEAQKTAYICCDGLCCWVGPFKTKAGFMKLVGPNNIINTIEENLSGIEQEEIMSILHFCDYQYKLDYFDTELLKAIKKEK